MSFEVFKPRKLVYHVTKLSNLDSILATGIEPRAGSYRDSHWQPVVFLVSQRRHAEEMIMSFRIDSIVRKDTSRTDHNGMVILTVDPKRMDALFLRDPDSDGIFTISAVPPTAIVGHKLMRRRGDGQIALGRRKTRIGREPISI